MSAENLEVYREQVRRLPQPIVYTAGVYDLLHRGHVRLLLRARGLGASLVVAVSTDELVSRYKNNLPVISYEERVEIVSAIKGVDLVVPQVDRDKYRAFKQLGFDIWVVGDDWYGHPDYMRWAERIEADGGKAVFLSYTEGVSSSARKQEFRERLTQDGVTPQG